MATNQMGLASKSKMTAIANAIRTKLGVSTQYSLDDMPTAIASISGGGITPTGTLPITENGTYDVTQFASAAVNVSCGGGGSDLTPFFAIVGEVTPNEDSTSLGFPTDGKASSVANVIFFLAYVDDYTQFTDQNNMIVGCQKANMQYKVPNGPIVAKTIQTIDTSRTPPINYWTSATNESISGNNYVISNSRSSFFKAGVKYNYVLLGVSA